METTTFTAYTARCSGLGGCGRTFRITRETLDVTRGMMSAQDRADAAAALGLVQTGEYTGEQLDALAAVWGYDTCLSCATGEDYPAEYVAGAGEDR